VLAGAGVMAAASSGKIPIKYDNRQVWRWLEQKRKLGFGRE
jgi:hypothetical protein